MQSRLALERARAMPTLIAVLPQLVARHAWLLAILNLTAPFNNVRGVVPLALLKATRTLPNALAPAKLMLPPSRLVAS